MAETSPAAAASSGAAPELSATRRRWIFAATLVTMFMAAVEGTIVATAMPTIVGQLGGFQLFSWVFTSYLLTQAVTVPIYGRLADLYGRKRVLLFGIGLFLLGSLLCGFAWSMLSLIAFRVLQGIGAGAVLPVAITLLGDLYTGAARARMQGYVSSAFGSAAIAGPLIGAFLVAHASWPLVFWVNVPLCVVTMALLAVSLREKIEHRSHRIDYLGSVLLALGIGVLMFALVQASALSHGTFIALLAVAAALLIALFFQELRAPEPMLPLALWRNRIVAGGNVVNFAAGAAAMGITAFLPAYVQGVMGRSAFLAGLALTAMSGGWPLGGFFAGQVMLRTSYRTSALSGSVLLIIGSLLLIALNPDRGPGWAITGALFLGLGMGLSNNSFMVSTQATIDWAQRGAATSSLVFSRLIGQTMGTAIFGGILNAGLADKLGGDSSDLVNRIMEPSLRRTIPFDALQPLMQSFAQALHNIYLINLVLVLMIFGASVNLPAGLSPLKPRRDKR